MKLNLGEYRLLQNMARLGPVHCIETKPIGTLVKLGFAKQSGASAIGKRYVITDAGRAALEQGGQS